MRFNLNADTIPEAIKYLQTRALQIAHTGAILSKIIPFDDGAWAVFEYESRTYYALYLISSKRGRGNFYKLWKDKCNEIGYEINMITTTHCQLASYYRHKQIPFIMCNGLTTSEEYNIIDSIYGDKTTMRSGVELMNHIDEGLYILHKINASLYAKLAYILHPVFQSDTDLVNSYKSLTFEKADPKALILAMEYRHIANDYLSYRSIDHIEEIKLSPLVEVTNMLIADKIQNYKDFLKYHLNSHERSNELQQYFSNWFAKLMITDNFYQATVEEINSIADLNKKLVL